MEDYNYDLLEYDDTPATEFCSECMCDVPLDSFGDRECTSCNPQHSYDVVDEDGIVQELNFHEV